MTEACSKRVVEALVLGLETPSPVDGDVLRFAEDVLGLVDSSQWHATLNDPQNPDREMLAELLLFPGAATKKNLERILAGAQCMQGDADALALVLAGKRASFLLPGDERLEFDLTGADARLLVRRLRLARAMPVQVLAALEDQPEAVSLAACLRLRRARFPWDAGTEHFVRTLILNLGGHPDFAALLDFSCLFLEAEAQTGDLAAAMVRRRQDAERHLKNHQAFQQRLDKSNYETMRLSGDQAPHVDPAALRGEIQALDRLCPAVFGRSVVSGQVDRDLGRYAGAQGVQDLLSLLGDD